MTTNKAYSHSWFLYNDLSQITPMPPAWDKTASGPANCATKVSDCAAVYKYLDSQSKALTSYVGSPIWSVVDGPWKLSAFNADGHITFVPNPKYSGPIKPTLAQFQEVPFTTDSAEYNVLRSPAAGGQKIDVGYLPSQDAPANPAGSSPLTAGSNPLQGYTLDPLYVWGINYFVMNFQTNTGNGPIIQRLYFRQALAYLLNQEAVIKGPLRGYGTLTQGRVGNTPVTPYLSPQQKGGPIFPYSPDKAKSLLSSHGWKVTPNGVTTCTNPSLCGPGTEQGQGLQFNLPVTPGMCRWVGRRCSSFSPTPPWSGSRSTWRPSRSTRSPPWPPVTARLPRSRATGTWPTGGDGWSFAPDYSPTGETLFLCGAIANSGGYCSKTNDDYINSTLTSNDPTAMFTWQNYLADAAEATVIPDERLELIFMCCHPALATEAQVALTLRAVGGLATEEIARAFLVPPETMKRRLTRAKSKIKVAGIPFSVPSGPQLPGRLGAVLAVVYLIFNEGYGDPGRPSLAAEAIRLGRVLAAVLPGQPEVLGLLALMLLHDSRRDARFDGQDLVLLPDQDRSRWDWRQLAEGRALLDQALLDPTLLDRALDDATAASGPVRDPGGDCLASRPKISSTGRRSRCSTARSLSGPDPRWSS